jgi:hypothetical protein
MHGLDIVIHELLPDTKSVGESDRKGDIPDIRSIGQTREAHLKDLVIDSCHWHVDAEAAPYKQRALDHFRDRYTMLLDFLRAEGLLADPSVGQDVSDWLSFEFRQSHLTEEGFALVKLCHSRWNPAFGEGHTQRHLIQWRRKLAGLRGGGGKPRGKHPG